MTDAYTPVANAPRGVPEAIKIKIIKKTATSCLCELEGGIISIPTADVYDREQDALKASAALSRRRRS